MVTNNSVPLPYHVSETTCPIIHIESLKLSELTKTWRKKPALPNLLKFLSLGIVNSLEVTLTHTHTHHTPPHTPQPRVRSAAYMRQWIGPTSIQIMTCRLFGAKSLSAPMLGYCQLDPWEQTSVIFFIKIQKLSFTKLHMKISSAKWQSFCPGRDEWMGISNVTCWYRPQRHTRHDT